MRHFVGKPLRLATLGVLALALAAATLTAQYNMTVNKDRLLNAQNEPQNWLMMNGDYGATRYSKLSQINRENVKNLRMIRESNTRVTFRALAVSRCGKTW